MKSFRPFILLILLSTILWQGCGKKEDPLEKERLELEQHLKGIKVSVYKGLKIALRALPLAELQATGNTDAAKRQVIIDSDTQMEAEHIYLLAYDLYNRLGQGEVAADSITTGWELSDYWTVAKEIYQLEKSLETINEDEYPTILENLTGAYNGDNGVLTWYTNSHEHAILAALLIASRKAPTDLVLYEATMLRPSEMEDPFLKLGSYSLRSGIFLIEDFNYLSEYEATQYLTALKTYQEFIINSNPDNLFDNTLAETDEQIYAQFHCLGVLLRGIARYRIGKEDEAIDDLDDFLKDAETIGLESEIVWLIGAYVSLYKERQEDALMYIGKLKKSNIFGKKEREFLEEIETYVQARESDKAMNKLFDNVFISRMVVEICYSYIADVDWHNQIESTETGKQLLQLGDDSIDEYNEIVKYVSVDGLQEKGNEIKEEGKKLYKDVKGWLKKSESE